jgi:hypothetical protein
LTAFVPTSEAVAHPNTPTLTSNFEFCDCCEEEGLRQTEEIQLRDRAIDELRDEIARLQKIIRGFGQTPTHAVFPEVGATLYTLSLSLWTLNSRIN